MSCTQKQQLVSFSKVRIWKPWFRHFNDHKDFHNEGTVHLFSLMALFSYANFHSSKRVLNGERYMEAPGQWICKLGSLPRILRVHSKEQQGGYYEYQSWRYFLCQLSETVGSEERSGRPAIIVSNRLCNKHSPVVEVVYLTCQHKPPLPTHVRIDSAGRCSTALCEQITSVDVSRLGDYKGHLTDREMAQVDTALMASLELHPLARQAKVEPIGPHVDDSALALIALRFLEGFLQNRSCAKNVSGFHTDLSDQKNG
jgi:mRNA-degrading endonuclease toxin of MazEF toxin-antitoxin module